MNSNLEKLEESKFLKIWKEKATLHLDYIDSLIIVSVFI